MLIEANPKTYSRPAYLGPAGWVGIDVSGDPDWALVEDRMTLWREVSAADNDPFQQAIAAGRLLAPCPARFYNASFARPSTFPRFASSSTFAE